MFQMKNKNLYMGYIGHVPHMQKKNLDSILFGNGAIGSAYLVCEVLGWML